MKRNAKILLALVAVILLVSIIVAFWSNKAVAPEGQTTAKESVSDFDKTQHSLTDPTSIWVVINKLNPLQPIDFAPTDLTQVGGGQFIRTEARGALAKMFAAAYTQGVQLSPLSGFRSYQTQVRVYGNEVKSFGQVKADSESARPGYSEHQTGLAIDVGGGGCGIENCFGNTKAGQWLATNAYKYGFIIRYPADKVSITGYRYEPWHVRYVGAVLANEMHKQNIETLEEFFGLPPAPNY